MPPPASPGIADVVFVVPAGLDHQADLPFGAACAAETVRHRARGHRGRRRLVGCRSVHRQSGLEKASGYCAGEALRRRSRLFSPARSKNFAPCSTTGRSTGNGAICRPRCGTSSKRKKFFGMIIPKAIWRPRLFRLRAFGSGAQTFVALDCRRRAPRWCRTRSGPANC